MMGLLVFREQVKTFYGKYSRYILPTCKFVFALTAFISITLATGYRTALNNPFIPILLAVICAFTPSAMITFFICCLILIHLSAVSIEIMVVAAVIFILMFLLYFVFKPGNAWLDVSDYSFGNMGYSGCRNFIHRIGNRSVVSSTSMFWLNYMWNGFFGKC